MLLEESLKRVFFQLATTFLHCGMDLDYYFIRLSFERLRNVFRNYTRSIEKDIQTITQDLTNIHEATSSLTKGQAIHQLNTLLGKIRSTKKKVCAFEAKCTHQQLEDINTQEQIFIEKCRTRTQNLITGFSW